MTTWIIGGVALLVLIGEPAVRFLWANRGKLAQLQQQRSTRKQFEDELDILRSDELTEAEKEAEKRAQAFRAVEEVVAYFDGLGDQDGAEEARAAGRLLFGKPAEPTTTRRG